MSRLMVASVALAVAAAACGDDTRGAGGSGAGGAMSVPQGSGGSAPAGDTTPSSSAEGPSTTADASTGASTDGWECFIQGDGCQCDQLGFDYDLEDCGDWVCCVAYPDSGDGASCLCGDDQAVCNDLLEIDAGASPSASCPP